jgi:RNA polymerase sigma factor (sigma-70 family)
LLNTLTDMELVDEILDGNGAAFRAFYYRHVDNIYAMVTRIMGPGGMDREDAVQQIFFHAHKSAADFKKHSDVSSELLRIAVQVTSSMLRKSSKASTTQRDDAPILSGLEDRPTASSAVKKMYEIIDRLDLKNRMVFVLYEFQELTLEQISKALNIPVNTAAARLSQSREQIIPLLSDQAPNIREEK